MAKYIKCSDEAHRLVKRRAAETDEEMQQIADEAIISYFKMLGSVPEKSTVDSEKSTRKIHDTVLFSKAIPPGERPLHEQLSRVLAGGVSVEAIKQTFTFLEQLTEQIHGQRRTDTTEAELDPKERTEAVRKLDKKFKPLARFVGRGGKNSQAGKKPPPDKAAGGGDS